MGVGDVTTATNDSVGIARAIFDGIDDFISYATDKNYYIGSFSVSLWVKILDDLGLQVILAKYSGASYANTAGGQGWELLYRGDNAGRYLDFRVNSGGGTDGVTTRSDGGSYVDIADNDWHNIILIANKTLQRGYIYVDGTNVVHNDYDNISSNPGSFDNTGNLIIGRQSGTGNGTWFKGTFNELCIYNRVLSSTEITNLANNIIPTDGLVSNIPLNKDYNDCVANNPGTNTGTTISIFETSLANKLKADRTTANDVFLITDSRNQIISAVIEEAP